jgi:hypothetical protein
LLLSVTAWAAVGEQSFTPNRVSLWVNTIVLSTAIDDGGEPAGDVAELYVCTTTEDCYIRVSDNDWLARITHNQSIKEGTYRYMTVTTCSEGDSTFPAIIQGQVQLGNDWYYTHATQGLRRQTGSFAPHDLQLTFTQCRFYYTLHTPLVIYDATTSPLTVLVDTTDSAWGRLGIQSIESGCFQGTATDGEPLASVCMGFPHFIPVAQDRVPNQSRFYIHNPNQSPDTAGAALVIYTDDSSHIVGGFAKRVYSPNSVRPAYDYWDTAIKQVAVNPNGTWFIQTAGRLFHTDRITLPDFSLNSHNNRLYYNPQGQSFDYSAQYVLEDL